MRYSVTKVVFQEVPHEISLALHITGCPVGCKGCHSSDYWSPRKGDLLDLETLESLIQKYQNYITCLLFLGGEWEASKLIEFLMIARAKKLKTGLYTGLELKELNPLILPHLDYLKYGPWIEDLGGLSEVTTNQRLINVKTGQLLNIHFQHGGQHDSLRQFAD